MLNMLKIKCWARLNGLEGYSAPAVHSQMSSRPLHWCCRRIVIRVVVEWICHWWQNEYTHCVCIRRRWSCNACFLSSQCEGAPVQSCTFLTCQLQVGWLPSWWLCYFADITSKGRIEASWQLWMVSASSKDTTFPEWEEMHFPGKVPFIDSTVVVLQNNVNQMK